MPSKVIIIDYGSQVTQLIARRVREAGVYSEIHSCITTAAQVAAMKPSAIILSGGPASVGEADAPVLDQGNFPTWVFATDHKFAPPMDETTALEDGVWSQDTGKTTTFSLA